MVAGTSCQRTWDTGGGEDPKSDTNKRSAPALGAGKWRRSGTWNLAILGTRRCTGFVRQIYLLLNIKLLKCCLSVESVQPIDIS